MHVCVHVCEKETGRERERRREGGKEREGDFFQWMRRMNKKAAAVNPLL